MIHVLTNKPLIVAIQTPRWLRWVVLCGWLAFFLLLLLQPEEQPLVATGIPPGPPSLGREIVFTAGHIGCFILTMALTVWALRSHFPLKTSLWLAIGGTLLFGVITELLQTTAPGRSPSLLDLLANTIGILLVVLTICWQRVIW